MKNFTDLDTWKEAHTFVLSIYKLTRRLPTDERFGLMSQMRRAAVSITSNIAEGFGRQSNKEKLRFYSIASGSLVEVQNQIMVMRDVGYATDENYEVHLAFSSRIYMMLNGLIRSIKSRINPSYEPRATSP